MKYKEGTYYGNEINVRELIEYCREHDDIVVGFGSLDDNNEYPEKYPIHIWEPLKTPSFSCAFFRFQFFAVQLFFLFFLLFCIVLLFSMFCFS